MNLAQYMLPAHAAVFLTTIPYAVAIIIAALTSKRALRKSTSGDGKERIWHKLKVALAVLTSLYVAAVLAFTLPNFTSATLMHVLMVLTIGISAPMLIYMPLVFIDEEKATKNTETYVPNILAITAVIMLGVSFTVGFFASQDSSGYANGTPVAEKVNGETVEYRRALERVSDGKYLTINAIKEDNGIPRAPRIETITYYTWLERDTDNTIKTVTVNVGDNGGVTIADDLPAGEAPYVTYTPMYYTNSAHADGANLCVGGRDKGCDLNATYAYDKATVHIPTGTTSDLVVTNREAKE